MCCLPPLAPTNATDMPLAWEGKRQMAAPVICKRLKQRHSGMQLFGVYLDQYAGLLSYLKRVTRSCLSV